MASGLILDYLGSGAIADRPATPDLYSGSLGLWFATDTDVLSLWDGSTWTDVTGSAVNSVNGLTGTVVLALDDIDDVDAAAPSDGDVLTWVAANSAWEPAPGGGSGGGAAWGGITGTLSDQTDLQAALDDVAVQAIQIAVSDEATALTTGTAKTTFRMPYAFTLTAVRASVTTAPTGATLTVDINEGGVSILSTKLTIDATEKTSTTAATPPVISDAALADDAEITIDIDQVGSTIAGAGLKISLIGYRT